MAEKQLSLEVVKELGSSFEKDDKNQLAQNAAAKQGINEMMASQDKMKGRVHVYNTRLPDEGKPVTNQKSSGRCWIFAVLNSMRCLTLFKTSKKAL